MIKSDLSVKPEVIITGENRVNVESRFPCNVKPQRQSFQVTEVLGHRTAFQVLFQKESNPGWPRSPDSWSSVRAPPAPRVWGCGPPAWSGHGPRQPPSGGRPSPASGAWLSLESVAPGVSALVLRQRGAGMASAAVGAGAVLRQAERLGASGVPGEQGQEAGGSFPPVRLILDCCTVFRCLRVKETCSK